MAFNSQDLTAEEKGLVQDLAALPDSGAGEALAKENGEIVNKTVGGGSGTPGGSDTQVQFNDGGTFGGDAGFTFNKTTNDVTITGALSASNVSGTNTGDQNLFGTIAVSGQSDVVADSTNDTLTLVAGSNVTITTNAGSDSITISASGGGGGGTVDTVVAGTGISVDSTDPANPVVSSTITQYTDELAQDAVGGILTNSSEINLTYNDGTPSITASLVAGSIDETKLDTSVNASLDLADSAIQNLAGLGVTASAAELNVLDGITATTAELNYTDGVTSAIQTQLDGKVDKNGAITGATKTRITYDTKGLVTSGADATTADIADSANKRYVTDAQLTVIGNTSGTNTGDQSLFRTIAVSGQSDIIADTTADTLTIAAGAGTTITTDAGTDTLTIASSITQYTDELAQDAVGTILTDSTEINFTYTDATPSITASIAAASIDESKLDASVNTSLDLADSAVQDLADLGITASASELNVLDGITSSTAELNILTGVTATAAELNITDGLTATTSELNTLDGITATTAELNYTDGVTSAIQTQLDGKLPSSYLDTDPTLAANSDTKIASQKATKAYADSLLAANDAMTYKGATDCSANPNYPAGNAGDTYKVSVAGKIGGVSGVVVGVGDMYICTVDGSASGNQATVGANWNVIQANLDGAVIGPTSATDSNIAAYDGTTGKLIKDSGVATSALVTGSSTTTFTNKTFDADGTGNSITNIENADIKSGAAIALNKLAATTASRALASDASGFVTASATTATELGYVSGVTSAIQTQFGTKVTGPASALDNTMARFDSTTGKLIKAGSGVSESVQGTVNVNPAGTSGNDGQLSILNDGDGSNATLRISGSGTGANYLNIRHNRSGNSRENYLNIDLNDTSTGVTRNVSIGGDVTLTGAFATSGGNPVTLTTTGATNVTLPTTGTLVNSSVSTLSSLTTVGNISTGTWSATTIGVDRGGTGETSYTNGQLLIGNTTGNTLTKASLTAGAGITITPGPGSITIASTGGSDYTSYVTAGGYF